MCYLSEPYPASNKEVFQFFETSRLIARFDEVVRESFFQFCKIHFQICYGKAEVIFSSKTCSVIPGISVLN